MKQPAIYTAVKTETPIPVLSFVPVCFHREKRHTTRREFQPSFSERYVLHKDMYDAGPLAMVKYVDGRRHVPSGTHNISQHRPLFFLSLSPPSYHITSVVALPLTNTWLHYIEKER
jgi:hypothetical protein